MRTYTLKKVQGQPDWNTVPVMPISQPFEAEHEMNTSTDGFSQQMESALRQLSDAQRAVAVLRLLPYLQCLPILFRPARWK